MNLDKSFLWRPRPTAGPVQWVPDRGRSVRLPSAQRRHAVRPRTTPGGSLCGALRHARNERQEKTAGSSGRHAGELDEARISVRRRAHVPASPVRHWMGACPFHASIHRRNYCGPHLPVDAPADRRHGCPVCPGDHSGGHRCGPVAPCDRSGPAHGHGSPRARWPSPSHHRHDPSVPDDRQRRDARRRLARGWWRACQTGR